MRIGLIDVDAWSRGSTTFPNISLMKLSAYHKRRCDQVEWYDPDTAVPYDRVYLNKVFSDEYSRDYDQPVRAKEVFRRGSGYALSVVNGVEAYNRLIDLPFPAELDHIYPDYHLYQRKVFVPDVDDKGEELGTGYYKMVDMFPDTAYGFMTKGCPNNCDFCHVCQMQGRKVWNFANLSEFWNGQKNIVLLDPNITASKDFVRHMGALADTGAYVDFSQGLDARLLTEEKIHALNRVRYKRIHFAWDNPRQDLADNFRMIAAHLRRGGRDAVSCYVLTNHSSTHEDDLRRIYTLREVGFHPYIMIYRKPTASQFTRRLQRWCNAPALFYKFPTFGEYCRATYKGGEGLEES